MGWNDRVENNPYEPYPDYTEQDHYEAWMHYQELCRQERPTSQNIDPATLSTAGPPTLLARIFTRILGQPEPEQQKTETPF
jgi:hypothetical protein